jgi:hypothetical protein
MSDDDEVFSDSDDSEPGQVTTDPRAILVLRLGFVVILSCLAVLLGYNGRKAVRERHFVNGWTVITSNLVDDRVVDRRVEKGEERLEGGQAVRFGVGMLAASLMLAGWSVGLAGTIVRGTTPENRSRWTALHTLATLLSFACLLTAMVCLLPPECFGRRRFITVFYGVIGLITVFVPAALALKQPRVAAFTFPALAVGAVFLPLFTGGILFGLFAWLVLATHLMLVVPALRRRAMPAGPSR